MSTLFSLIYLERDSDSDAMININGPELFLSEKLALEHLFQHVKTRITDACKEEFIENVFSFDVPLFDITGYEDEEEPVSAEQLEEIFDYIANNGKIEMVTDWYFELMNDETSEYVYSIKKHDIEINSVILVDQSDIPCSLDCISLFVNGAHILDQDSESDLDIDVKEMAETMAKNLNTTLKSIEISNKDLGSLIAESRGELYELNEMIKNDPESENELYEQYTDGYSNSDVIALLKLKNLI